MLTAHIFDRVHFLPIHTLLDILLARRKENAAQLQFSDKISGFDFGGARILRDSNDQQGIALSTVQKHSAYANSARGYTKGLAVKGKQTENLELCRWLTG